VSIVGETAHPDQFQRFADWEKAVGQPRADARVRTLAMAQAAGNLFLTNGHDGIDLNARAVTTDFVTVKDSLFTKKRVEERIGVKVFPVARGYTVDVGSAARAVTGYRNNDAVRHLVLEPASGKLVTVDESRTSMRIAMELRSTMDANYMPHSRKEIGEYVFKLSDFSPTPFPVRGLEPIGEEENLRREEEVQRRIIALTASYGLDTAPLEEIVA
jgi:hypothetical protein